MYKNVVQYVCILLQLMHKSSYNDICKFARHSQYVCAFSFSSALGM